MDNVCDDYSLLKKKKVDLAFRGLTVDILKLREMSENQQVADNLTHVLNLVDQYYDALMQTQDQFERVKPDATSSDDPVEVEKKSLALVNQFIRKGNMASLAQTFIDSPLSRELGKRNEVWKDILVTERTYFQSLVSLYETFVKPLKIRTRGEKIRLNDKNIRKIFMNIEEIKEISKNMWKDLEYTARRWPQEVPLIGNIFMKYAESLLHEYTTYISGLPESLKLLHKQRKNQPEFDNFIIEAKVVDISGGKEVPLPITSLLMLPLLRIYSYETYMEELLTLTPSDHVDYENILSARSEIMKLTSNINTERNGSLKLKKAIDIGTSLKAVPNKLDAKAIFLNNLTRYVPDFIREGPCFLVQENDLQESYLYLFREVLVVALSRHNEDYKLYYNHFAIESATVNELAPSANAEFPLIFSASNGKSIVVALSTGIERESWLREINQLLEFEIIPEPEVFIIKTTKQKKRMFGEVFSEALSQRPDENTLEEIILDLPDEISVVKIVKKNEIYYKSPSIIDIPDISEIIFSNSMTLFPFDPKINGFIQDPIADVYRMSCFKNWGIIALANGENTPAGKISADIAIDAFASSLKESKQMNTIRDIGYSLLKAIESANEAILNISEPTFDIGTTSLIGGGIFQVDCYNPNKRPQYCYISACVGNCHGYYWSSRLRTITKITSSDIPGYLGPHIFGYPNLNNLNVYMTICFEGDFILMVSPGVHLNFDPEILGIPPIDAMNVEEKDSFDDIPATWLELQKYHEDSYFMIKER
eukprot:TRINITY_DN1498_c0_g1_i7.p1 TRINITY_DN1498_c0_g1~~TRINITY_DN1498_c0_g1_i7.p1  ORF type:complete len:765 (-),score=166.22 TRINITY_DN1498_c0_g1_i7:316-2610(-)